MRLPDVARIAVPHPVELGDAVAARAEVFADYEIAQLGRHVDALTEAERGTGLLERFDGAAVLAGADEAGNEARLRAAPTARSCAASRMGTSTSWWSSAPASTSPSRDATSLQKLHEVRFTRRPGDDLDAVPASKLLADLARPS